MNKTQHENLNLVVLDQKELEIDYQSVCPWLIPDLS